jgi:hypothetical protein
MCTPPARCGGGPSSSSTTIRPAILCPRLPRDVLWRPRRPSPGARHLRPRRRGRKGGGFSRPTPAPSTRCLMCNRGRMPAGTTRPHRPAAPRPRVGGGRRRFAVVRRTRRREHGGAQRGRARRTRCSRWRLVVAGVISRGGGSSIAPGATYSRAFIRRRLQRGRRFGRQFIRRCVLVTEIYPGRGDLFRWGEIDYGAGHSICGGSIDCRGGNASCNSEGLLASPDFGEIYRNVSSRGGERSQSKRVSASLL